MNNQHKIPQDQYLTIPNPIYDVVFKYLMEDNQSAKIIISTLINEKIKKLSFAPTSHADKIQDTKSEKEIKLFHLDFTAVIEDQNGEEELIMIEIQKANRANDIFRFKRYISANFQQKQEKEIINPRTQAVEKIDKPIRLIPIFILNFRIENEINDLIIKVNRTKTGVFKEKELKKHNEFIDNLSFDILVVQLPNMNQIDKSDYQQDPYKSKLYALLKLFDQEARNEKNTHWLSFVKSAFPEFLERIIKRLKAAKSNNLDLENQMNAEDEYLAELVRRDNEIIFFKDKFEKTASELEKTASKLEKAAGNLEKEKKLREEKEKKLDQKNKALDQKNKALDQKNKALDQKNKLILELAKTLKDNNIPVEIISKKTNLSKETIEKL